MSFNKLNVRVSQNVKISKFLYCGVCSEIFLQPMRISCGHTFCKQCIYNDQKNPFEFCPLCLKKILKHQIQKDILGGKLVDQIKVQCKNTNCKWVGTFIDYKFHTQKCQLENGVEGFLQKLKQLREKTKSQLESICLDNVKQKQYSEQEVEKTQENLIQRKSDVLLNKIETRQENTFEIKSEQKVRTRRSQRMKINRQQLLQEKKQVKSEN